MSILLWVYAGHKNDVYWVDASSIPALRSTANLPKENPK